MDPLGSKAENGWCRDIVPKPGKPSFVEDLINFKACENPSWRKKKGKKGEVWINIHHTYPPIREMVRQIVEWQKKWNDFSKSKTQANSTAFEDARLDVYHSFLVKFIHHINVEEEHGCGTYEETEQALKLTECEGSDPSVPESPKRKPKTVEETETINLKHAHDYLCEQVSKENSEDYGFYETGLLKELHKCILKDIPIPEYQTPPGVMSEWRRSTEFDGEIYEYPIPDDMEKTVSTLLDQYNSLLVSVKSEEDEVTKMEKLFKVTAWVTFELLDLHPFSDGNGRLCRLFASYTLSTFTPFPTPIYNVWTDSAKDDYKRALVEARKSKSRHPASLTTMIIECNWKGWESFMKQVKQKLDDGK